MERKKHMITASDIAKIAGVSRQAVSSTLTGRGNSKVADEKRREILRLARELGYRSNVSARQLAGHRTYTIGLGIDTYSIAVAMGRCLTDAIKAAGYRVLQVSGSIDTSSDVLHEMESRGVEGIISLLLPDCAREKFSVPIVQIGHQGADLDLDYENSGYQAGRHFLRHGRKHVVLIDNIDRLNGDLQEAGLTRALRETPGSTVGKIMLLHNPDGNRLVLDAVRGGCDAFFCANDFFAWRLSVFLRQQGVRVPGDVAIIGLGGHTYNEYTHPSIASLVYPVHELARLAVRRLLDKIESGSTAAPAQPLLVPPVLNPGESCGCPERILRSVFWEGNFVSIESAYNYRVPPPPELQDHYASLVEK